MDTFIQELQKLWSAITGKLDELTTKMSGALGRLGQHETAIDQMLARIKLLEDKLAGVVTPPVEPPVEPPPATREDILFYDRNRVRNQPKSGESFVKMVARANGRWEEPVFIGEDPSNNAQGDADVLSGALAAEALDDDPLRAKSRAHLDKLPSKYSTWLLGLSRQLPGYVQAALLLGYAPKALVDWFHKQITYVHGSGQRWGSLDTILITGLSFNSNWGIMSLRAIVAVSVYLLKYGSDAQKADATNWLRLAVLQYKRFVGEPGDYSALPKFITAANGWGGSTGPGYGVNPEGSVFVTLDGVEHDGSGILQGDWLRAKIRSGLPGAGSEDRDADYYPPQPVTYHWEGLTSLIVLAAILDNLGLVPFNAGNNAIVRAMKALYGQSRNSPAFVNKASGDDVIAPHIVFNKTGIDFGRVLDLEPDKAGFGWLTWYYA
jgi:hypothetical protein